MSLDSPLDGGASGRPVAREDWLDREDTLQSQQGLSLGLKFQSTV